ncbi:hypothetical protein BSLG_010420 [Batrachochytrium salamandrivorans]|nr:hypothetical protein BSLG_010420 [Batrachochytrium salamandrivorans]
MKFFTFFIAAMATATSVAAVAIPYANRAEHHPDMLQKRSNSIDMISLDSNSPQGTVHLERRQSYSDKVNAEAKEKIEKRIKKWQKKIYKLEVKLFKGDGNRDKIERKIEEYKKKITDNGGIPQSKFHPTADGSQTAVKPDDEGGKDGEDGDGKDGTGDTAIEDRLLRTPNPMIFP